MVFIVVVVVVLSTLSIIEIVLFTTDLLLGLFDLPTDAVLFSWKEIPRFVVLRISTCRLISHQLFTYQPWLGCCLQEVCHCQHVGMSKSHLK